MSEVTPLTSAADEIAADLRYRGRSVSSQKSAPFEHCAHANEREEAVSGSLLDRQASSRTLLHVGVVIIGRNEGQRLSRCFDSLPAGIPHVVYVDSGSTDDSVQQARRRGIDLVELDISIPFTAARSRNAGFRRLLEIDPTVKFVQFVDGDCELQPGWIETAVEAITADASIAIVSGRLRERSRDASIYSRLCDLEWDKPVNEGAACGGNSLIRAAAFGGVGGFDGRLIAGEEPELCFRLRREGHRILRIASEMALHDANITVFAQWWRRSLRSGYACADLSSMHPSLVRKQIRSTVLWGLVVPATAVFSTPIAGGRGLALLFAYPALWTRIVVRRRTRGDSLNDAALYASFCVLGKFAELAGVAKYWANRSHRRESRLIEYK